MLTAEQILMRRNVIGASEAAAVLGRSPWATPTDVYYRKVGDVLPDKPNAAQAAGTRLEPVIVQWAAEELGVKIRVDCGTILHPSRPLGASPDGMVIGRNEAIEAKMSSVPDEWGEPGTDEIPEHYLIQTHHQMFVLGVERVWVPVLLMGYRAEWRMYCVNANPSLAQKLADIETDWWKKHIEVKSPPTNSPPPMEFLKRLRRQPESTALLGQQAVAALDQWEAANAAKKVAVEAEETAKATLLTMLGVENPVEYATLPDGRVLTYKAQNSAPSVDTARLRAEWPAAHAACVSQNQHRVLRIKKPSSKGT